MAKTAEREKLDLEREELELEKLRADVDKLRGERMQRMMQRERMAQTLKDNETQEALRRASCKHRKGGKNKAGFLNGNDSNYSVIHHTYPEGRLVVMCTRCQSEWEKPPIELRKTDPKTYREKMAAYQEALNWPTDNEPSGTQLFLITRDGTPAPELALG